MTEFCPGDAAVGDGGGIILCALPALERDALVHLLTALRLGGDALENEVTKLCPGDSFCISLPTALALDKYGSLT